MIIRYMFKIPENELEYSFSRSSGKGGQNVNKVETKVSLKWDMGRSQSLDDGEKNLVRTVLKNRINKDGYVVVVCDEKRTQFANLAVARYKLAFLIQKALKRPKKRFKTIPTKASRLKRLEKKRKISLKKQNRRSITEF